MNLVTVFHLAVLVWQAPATSMAMRPDGASQSYKELWFNGETSIVPDQRALGRPFPWYDRFSLDPEGRREIMAHQPLNSHLARKAQELRDKKIRESTIAGEWILVIENGIRSKKDNVGRLRQLAKTVDGTLIGRAIHNRSWTAGLVRTADHITTEDFRAKLAPAKREDLLMWVPNRKWKLFGIEDDPLFPQQWNLRNRGLVIDPRSPDNQFGHDIGAVDAWETESGTRATVIAIIDTGVAYDHPDLVDNMWHNPGEIPGNGLDDDENGYVDDVVGYDFGSDDSDPYDVIGHGTHVAGIAGASGGNGIGVSGVSPQVSLMALKGFSDTGVLTSFSAVSAIEYAAANGARAANASWGGPFPDPFLEMAIRDAGERGMLFVAAAGNDAYDINYKSFDSSAYPAGFSLDNLITVGATDITDEMTFYSNYGTNKVHLFAPGSYILSTIPGRRVVYEENFDRAPIGGLPEGMQASGPNPTWGTVADAARGSADNRALHADALAANPDQPDGDGAVEFPVLNLAGLGEITLAYDYSLDAEEDFLAVIQFWRHGEWVTYSGFSSRNGNYHDRAFFHSETRLVEPFPSEETRLRIYWKRGENPEGFGLEIDNILIYASGPGEAAPSPEGYARADGTSMSAPHVTGAAALLWSHDPEMSPAEVTMRLIHSGDEIASLRDRSITGRRLNLAKAFAAQGGPAWVDTGLLSSKVWQPGEPMNLLWTHFDNPDAPVTLEATQPDGSILTVAENAVLGGIFHWAVPDLEPGVHNLTLKISDQAYPGPSFEVVPRQKVQIPDFRLEGWLVEDYDIDGDFEISTWEVERYPGLLFLPRIGAMSYEGLEAFKTINMLILNSNPVTALPEFSLMENLEYLSVRMDGIASLPRLPEKLIALSANGNMLQRVDALPSNLEQLGVTDSPLVELPPLPESLVVLSIWNTKMEKVPPLPAGLLVLELGYNSFQQIPPIPKGVVRLDISGNPLTELPSFDGLSLSTVWLADLELTAIPEDLKINDGFLIGLRNNRLTEIESLPDDLTFLVLSENRLRSLPKLPGSLVGLEVSNNLLEELPDLPQTLGSLLASDNRLTHLPKLDHVDVRSLELVVNRNLLTEIGPLSPRHFSLECAFNRITALPDLPERIRSVTCSGNPIDTLPPLPPSLQVLTANNLNLTSVGELPAGLQVLDVAGNALTEPPVVHHLNSMSWLNLSDNLLRELPEFGENPRLLAFHIDRNLLGPENCEAINAMKERNLLGGLFVSFFQVLLGAFPLGERLDPFIYNPQKDGSLFNCDTEQNPVPEDPLTAALVRSGDGKSKLVWRGGARPEATLTHFEVWDENGEVPVPLARTTATDVRIPQAMSASGGTLRIVPHYSDGAEGIPTIQTVPASGPQTELAYPVQRLGTDGADYTAFALVNPTEDPVAYRRVYFDSLGQLLGESASQTLDAGHRHLGLLRNWSLADGIPLGNIASVEIRATASLETLVLDGQGDTAALARNPLGTAHLHGTISNANTVRIFEPLLTLHNPSPHDAREIDFHFRDNAGVLTNTASLNLEPKATWQGLLTDLLPSYQPGPTGLISYESEGPVHVDVSTWQGSSGLIRYTAFNQRGAGAVGGAFVHLPGLLHAWNDAAVTATVTFSAHGPDGVLLATKTIELPPHSYRLIANQNLLPQVSAGQFITPEATLFFQATSPVQLLAETGGEVLPLRAVDGSGYGDTVPAFADFANHFRAPHISMRAGSWQTRITILNGDEETAQVRITAFNSVGEALGDGSLAISGKGHRRFDGPSLLESGILTKRDDLEDIATMTFSGGGKTGFGVFVNYYAEPFQGRVMAGYWLPPGREEPR